MIAYLALSLAPALGWGPYEIAARIGAGGISIHLAGVQGATVLSSADGESQV